eukprot:1570806-Rhodomonas_salina.1
MMQAEILAFAREDNACGVDNSTLPSKRAKTHVPVGMALVAQQLSTAVDCITALSAQFQDKPQVCTSADKARFEREQDKSRDNAKQNQFSTPSKGIMKGKPKTPGSSTSAGCSVEDLSNT